MNQPYEQYKPSGIDWLGDIPNHWKITYLKNCADFTNGAAFKPEDWKHEGIPIVRIQNLNGSEDFNYIDPSQSVSEKAHLYGGELLFSWSGNIGTSFGPFFWKGNTEAYLNQHIFKVENFDLDKNYFYWLLRAVTKYIETKTHGVIGMVHITKPELGNIPVPKIDYTEQRAIATYLDRKTAQIDQLVAQKEQLLDLLQKKRQAIINEAVTRGLDANAPKKDSGIEWLGEIPAHWEVKKLKYLTTKIGSGVTPLGGANVYVDSGVPLLRSQNIYPDGLRLDDVAFITEEVHQSMKGSQVEYGDVLLNITGASIGRCYYYEGQYGEANVNQHVCIIRPNELISTQFLQLILSSELGQYQIDMSQNGASREGLTFAQLRNFDIPTPTLTEQESILNYVTNRLSKIQSAVKQIREQLSGLKTYRQSLISEVVTGKIDVRAKATAEV